MVEQVSCTELEKSYYHFTVTKAHWLMLVDAEKPVLLEDIFDTAKNVVSDILDLLSISCDVFLYPEDLESKFELLKKEDSLNEDLVRALGSLIKTLSAKDVKSQAIVMQNLVCYRVILDVEDLYEKFCLEFVESD